MNATTYTAATAMPTAELQTLALLSTRKPAVASEASFLSIHRAMRTVVVDHCFRQVATVRLRRCNRDGNIAFLEWVAPLDAAADTTATAARWADFYWEGKGKGKGHLAQDEVFERTA
ncbi:hypothetical protein FIBSPDRAFT_1015362 [Athelia psychrophila]|uniref:Uncharacterized protein n=1 Tax=Athelia psychrophila TaxID=1759441 RepID=A0A166LV49_9AGAM|nr:hypothetical protein FIBSPDRAFT_1015362 [Fibularhizoctonia sp. CBS 109695]